MGRKHSPFSFYSEFVYRKYAADLKKAVLKRALKDKIYAEK